MNAEINQIWPAPSNPKPVVIIGAGGIVRDAHLPAYQKAGLTVGGVSDVEASRAHSLADDWGIPKVYSSNQEATKTCGTNAIYDIAVPPHAIAGILTDLPDGAAVLIQKPMGTDQREARAIRQICRDKRLKAAVNFQLRFSPMMLAAKQVLNSGNIGTLLEIEVHLNIFTPWHLFPFLIPMERVEMAVHSIHYLDSIRAFAGNPNGVFARSISDPRSSDFAQTRTSVILDYDAPLRAVMSINHNSQAGRKFQSAWFRIEGTKGVMMAKLGAVFDYPNGEDDELWFCANGKDWEQIPLQGNWFIDSFMGSMRNVQRFDAGQDDVLYTSIEDAYQTMSLVEACFEATKAPSTPLVLD